MSEQINKLRESLHELETELSNVETLDEEKRRTLESLLAEIGQVLKQPGQPPRNDSLTSRLQGAAEQFESSHPTLFGIVSRTIDALGQMGI